MSGAVTERGAVEAAVVESAVEAVSDERLIAMLVGRARSDGLRLTGEGGLLRRLTKRVLESALEGGITDHVGYGKRDAAGRNSGNSRNGTGSKTVLTDVGPVEVKVSRDTADIFGPPIVRKRQRRLTGVDEMVLSLSAKGLTHGEIPAHLAEVYGAEVSKQTIITITDSHSDIRVPGGRDPMSLFNSATNRVTRLPICTSEGVPSCSPEPQAEQAQSLTDVLLGCPCFDLSDHRGPVPRAPAGRSMTS